MRYLGTLSLSDAKAQQVRLFDTGLIFDAPEMVVFGHEGSIRFVFVNA